MHWRTHATAAALVALTLAVIVLVWRNHELGSELAQLQASQATAACVQVPPVCAASVPVQSPSMPAKATPAAVFLSGPLPGPAAASATPPSDSPGFEAALKARLQEQEALQRSPFKP